MASIAENYFFTVLKSEKSKSKVPAGAVSSTDSLPVFQMASFSLCPHVVENGEKYLFLPLMMKASLLSSNVSLIKL